MGERRGAYRVLVRKLRRSWEDNIKMVFEKCDGGHGLIWLRVGTGGRLF
jgi:hypothetical protein